MPLEAGSSAACTSGEPKSISAGSVTAFALLLNEFGSFGGSASAPVWARIDPRVFLRDTSRLSRVQAAFLAAHHLPRVASVAVGTDDPAHLGELVEALTGEVEERAIQEYRRLLRDHLRDQRA